MVQYKADVTARREKNCVLSGANFSYSDRSVYVRIHRQVNQAVSPNFIIELRGLLSSSKKAKVKCKAVFN